MPIGAILFDLDNTLILEDDATEEALRRTSELAARRSEEHTSELQSPCNLVCRLLLEKKNFDYRAKRFVRAAHLPPLERHHGWNEIFSPELRAELRGTPIAFDPVDVYRARYTHAASAAA